MCTVQLFFILQSEYPGLCMGLLLFSCLWLTVYLQVWITELIEADKKARLGSKVVYSKKTKDERGCFICYEDYKHGDVLLRNPCNHQAHYDCLAEWMLAQGTCPVCRRC